jgi:hypothetical protein
MPHISIKLSQIKFDNNKFGIGETPRRELIIKRFSEKK